MRPRKKAIPDKIKYLLEAIAKGREYLENGAHVDWQGFRPLFVSKERDEGLFP